VLGAAGAALTGAIRKQRPARARESPRPIFFISIPFLKNEARPHRKPLCNLEYTIYRIAFTAAFCADASPQPQVQVPAQGLLFWQSKTTLLLPQNDLQALSRSGHEAHLLAAAGAGRRAGSARRAQARVSFARVLFVIGVLR
jgi:hypothetical protein